MKLSIFLFFVFSFLKIEAQTGEEELDSIINNSNYFHLYKGIFGEAVINNKGMLSLHFFSSEDSSGDSYFRFTTNIKDDTVSFYANSDWENFVSQNNYINVGGEIYTKIKPDIPITISGGLRESLNNDYLGKKIITKNKIRPKIIVKYKYIYRTKYVTKESRPTLAGNINKIAYKNSTIVIDNGYGVKRKYLITRNGIVPLKLDATDLLDLSTEP